MCAPRRQMLISKRVTGFPLLSNKIEEESHPNTPFDRTTNHYYSNSPPPPLSLSCLFDPSLLPFIIILFFSRSLYITRTGLFLFLSCNLFPLVFNTKKRWSSSYSSHFLYLCRIRRRNLRNNPDEEQTRASGGIKAITSPST